MRRSVMLSSSALASMRSWAASVAWVVCEISVACQAARASLKAVILAGVMPGSVSVVRRWEVPTRMVSRLGRLSERRGLPIP